MDIDDDIVCLDDQESSEYSSNTVAATSICLDCPICPYSSHELKTLELHIESAHFPSAIQPVYDEQLIPSRSGERNGNNFTCPVCFLSFDNFLSLDSHINLEHSSPSKVPPLGVNELNCPVCDETGFSCPDALTLHVNTQHFTDEGPDYASEDLVLAMELESKDRELERISELEEFNHLQAIYGFQKGRDFEKQSNAALIKAVEKGNISIADYHEKRIMLNIAERNGVDDLSSASFDMIPRIKSLSTGTKSVKRTFLCSTLDHYALSFGDTGWGCGYRNLQMLLSCLVRDGEYAKHLNPICQNSVDQNGFIQAPSVTKLQKAIEDAWKQGFDELGCKQLDGKLSNTCKWIGATEIAALLLSLRIRCRIVDFHRPSASDGKHSALMSWVFKYFSSPAEIKPPLYFQHHGHSRTIIGVEELRNSNVQLLVLDPSHEMQQLSISAPPNGLKRIRKTLASLKHEQYQIVSVEGFLDEQQSAASKVLESALIRIP